MRNIEKAGIPTVYLGSCRDMMAQLKPPRGVFIDFPLGHQCGKPNDVALQTQILKDTLNILLSAKTAGVMVDLDYQWDRPFSWDGYQAEMKEMLEEGDKTKQDWKLKD